MEKGDGFSLFCGSYLPARHCPTPVGQSVRCAGISPSLSLPCLVLFLSWRRFVLSFVFVFAPPRSNPSPSLSPYAVLLYVSPLSLFFSLPASSSLSIASIFLSAFVRLLLSANARIRIYVYIHTIYSVLARSTSSSDANIILKKISGLPDGSAPVFFDYFASTLFFPVQSNPLSARWRSALHLFHLSTR